MANFPETNHSLVARVKDLGDGVSWIEFMGIYQPVVYQMAKQRGLQDADANDVTQKVFVSVAGAIDRWMPSEERPPFRAWLTTITKHAITKTLSRRPPDRPVGSTTAIAKLNEIPERSEMTNVEFASEARRAMFRWATQKVRVDFTEATWDMFWRTSVLGESVADVATATGRSTGAVYMARYRVLARLKEEIASISSQWDLGNE